jgi:hypothetical protein
MRWKKSSSHGVVKFVIATGGVHPDPIARQRPNL